jgi:hypothetical protein
MLEKNQSARREGVKQPKRSSANQIKTRLDTWRETIERLRELPLEFVCFALAVELQEDPSQEEWKDHFRDHFLDVLRGRDAPRLSLRRNMTADPVVEYSDRIQYNVEVITDDVENNANSEAISAVFEHFGLSPDKPAHRGLLLAILADIYFNTPVRGRPKGTTGGYRWTTGALVALGAQVQGIEHQHASEHLSDTTIAEALKSNGQFGTIENLRKVIPAARIAFFDHFGSPPERSGGR